MGVPPPVGGRPKQEKETDPTNIPATAPTVAVASGVGHASHGCCTVKKRGTDFKVEIFVAKHNDGKDHAFINGRMAPSY